MMSSYIRIGGVALEPPADIYDRIRTFLNAFPKHIEEYEGLLNANPIWMGRLKGVGYLSRRTSHRARRHRPTHPRLGRRLGRSPRHALLRLRQVQVQRARLHHGDVWARYVVRMQEMRESTSICHQALDLLATLHDTRLNADAPKIVLPDREQMKTQMESLIHHFKIVTEGFQVPAGEATSSVEAPHGMMNYYVVSDGTAKPYRVHMRNDFATSRPKPCAKAASSPT
jgi:NADH-quinone oxidoreductase subunit D